MKFCSVNIHLACLHDQNKSGFFGGLALSSQLEQSEKFSKTPDWLEKAGPLKNHFYVDHVNRQYIPLIIHFWVSRVSGSQPFSLQFIALGPSML